MRASASVRRSREATSRSSARPRVSRTRDSSASASAAALSVDALPVLGLGQDVGRFPAQCLGFRQLAHQLAAVELDLVRPVADRLGFRGRLPGALLQRLDVFAGALARA